MRGGEEVVKTEKRMGEEEVEEDVEEDGEEGGEEKEEVQVIVNMTQHQVHLRNPDLTY